MTEPRFLAPRSLEAALDACGAAGALPLAGGTSLAVLLRSRLVEASTLVYLGLVPELQWLRVTDGLLRLGGGCTYRHLARAGEVAATTPELARVTGRIANPRVRSVATLGGALAHADPRQDLPPLLLALGASLRLATAAATREVPLEGFARGLMETALGEGELVVEVVVPAPVGRRVAYERFTPASDDDFPTVAVAAVADRGTDGRLAGLSVAVGAAAPAPFLVPGAASLLGDDGDGAGEPATGIEAVAEAAADASAPVADRHGSVAYKQEMVRVHVRRAVRRALAQA